MPEYRFFASYARANTQRDPLLLKFCEDLIHGIRNKIHAEEAYFFDEQSIPVGGRYPQNLESALRGARSFLAFYSPAYFNSPDCGREVKAFQMRIASYEQARGGSACGPLGVQWMSSTDLEGRIPESLKFVQYNVPAHSHAQRTVELRRMVSENGLRLIMERAEAGSSADKLAYIDIVDCYANYIRHITELYDLTPYGFQESYKDLPYDFPARKTLTATASEPVGNTTTSRERKGPFIIKVLFLIGTANSFHDVPQRTSLDCYHEEEDYFWKPYLPDDDHIFSLVSRAVNAEKGAIETLSWSTPPTLEALRSVLRRIEINNNVLLVIVDPWSCFLSHLSPGFEVIDHDRIPNAAMFLPINREDIDTRAKQQELEEKLAEVFGRIAEDISGLEDMLYDSPDALEAQLRLKIVQIRSRIVARAARNGRVRPLPQGSPLPTLSVASR